MPKGKLGPEKKKDNAGMVFGKYVIGEKIKTLNDAALFQYTQSYTFKKGGKKRC